MALPTRKSQNHAAGCTGKDIVPQKYRPVRKTGDCVTAADGGNRFPFENGTAQLCTFPRFLCRLK